jgi:hypothetical protein
MPASYSTACHADLKSDDFRRWVEAGHRHAKAEQERALEAKDEPSSVAAEVKSQEKEVEHRVDALTRVEASESVLKRLKAEETKVVELR